MNASPASPKMAADLPAVLTATAEIQDCIRVFGNLGPVCSVVVSQRRLFHGLHNGLVVGTELEDSGEPPLEVAAHSGTVNHMLVVSPPNREVYSVLLTCSSDETIKAWDVNTGEWINTFMGHVGSVEKIAYQGDTVYSCGRDGCIKLWNIASGECTTSLRCHLGKVGALALCEIPVGVEVAEDEFLPPSGWAITGSDDTLGKLIDTSKALVNATYQCQAPVLCAVYNHPNVFFGCSDGMVRGFDCRSAQMSVLFRGHTDAVFALAAFGPDIVSAADDFSVRQWSVKTWKPIHVYNGHSQGVTSIAGSTKTPMYTGSTDGSVRVWDRDGITQRYLMIEAAAAEANAKPTKRKGDAKKGVAKAKGRR